MGRLLHGADTGVHMYLASGRVYMGNGTLSPNTYGLRYEMDLKSGSRQPFSVGTALLRTCSKPVCLGSRQGGFNLIVP